MPGGSPVERQLALAQQITHTGSWDWRVLTNLALPGLNGLELRDRVLEMRPQTAVVLMSSYSRPLVLGDRPGGFLHKPFSRRDLLQAVTESLGQRRR